MTDSILIIKNFTKLKTEDLKNISQDGIFKKYFLFFFYSKYRKSLPIRPGSMRVDGPMRPYN